MSPDDSLREPLSSPTASGPSSPQTNDGRVAAHPKAVSFRRDSSNHPRASTDMMNEQSPLLKPSDDEPGLKVVSPADDDWDIGVREESKSSFYLLLLTLAGGGLQIAWSVEMSYGSPYLLSLGISKSLLAFVWIAGPLSGVLVQPYVGIKSDNCRSRWGKRRPFIVGGAVATIICLLVLSWTKEIVGGFLGLFGADPTSKGVKTTVLFFAVLFIYVLDFAINVIQAGIRAFIVDCAPTHQQEAANAWIIRTSGIGNILGYLSGYVYLPDVFPFLGDTQFKVLCAIACFILGVTVAISVVTIKERDPRMDPPGTEHDNLLHFFKLLYQAIQRLPIQIKRVCAVQFFAWIGWFPFLFYITTYIGEIYVEPIFKENPNMSKEEIDKVWEKGTRVGTFALLIFAITTFAASIVLPLIIAPTFKSPEPTAPTPLTPTTPNSLSNSYSNANGDYFSRRAGSRPRAKGLLRRWKWFLLSLQIEGFTLRRAWLFSHIAFTACMFLTLFVRSIPAATTLVALIGLPWALTNWAPFALIAAEISKRDAIRRGLIRPPPTRDGELLQRGEDDFEDQAGVVLGIHNVAISAPQILATLVSSLIFKFLQKPRGQPGDNSVAWVLRFGGCCALIAAWMAKKVGEENEDVKEVD